MTAPIYSFSDLMSQIDPNHTFCVRDIDFCFQCYQVTWGTSPSLWNDLQRRERERWHIDQGLYGITHLPEDATMPRDRSWNHPVNGDLLYGTTFSSQIAGFAY